MTVWTAALSQRLQAAATSADERIHWLDVPAGAAMPYVVLQVVSDPREEHLKGVPAARVSRVQADCIGRTYTAARQLAEEVIAALRVPATVAGVQFGHTAAEGPRDIPEEVQSNVVKRAVVDLLVEHKE